MHHKRTITLAAAIVITLCLASCKFPARFVIMNQSEDLIEITYAFKNTTDIAFRCPDGELYTTPSTGSADEISDRYLEWNQLGPDEYICLPSHRTVYVPLGPDMALKVVEHEDPGAEYGTRDISMFPIDSLLINGVSGSMRFSGAQVLRAFTRTEGTMTFYIHYQ